MNVINVPTTYLNESKKILEHNIDELKQKYVKIDAKSFMVFVEKNKGDYTLIEKFVSDFLEDYREMAKNYADVPEKIQILKKAFDKKLTLDDIMTKYIPNNVKFKQQVNPGDTLVFKLELITPIRRGIVHMSGNAYANGKLVTEAELMAQIVKTKDN